MINIKDYPKHEFAASEDTFVLSLPSRVNECNIGSSHGILHSVAGGRPPGSAIAQQSQPYVPRIDA